MSKARLCGFPWTTAGNILGSQHGCALPMGHDGDHRCHCQANSGFGGFVGLVKLSAAVKYDSENRPRRELNKPFKPRLTMTRLENLPADHVDITPTISRPIIIQICALAGVDERCVRRLIRGEAIRPANRARVLEAMNKLGITLPTPLMMARTPVVK